MKFTSTLISAVLALSVSAIPVEKRGVNPALVPQFGVNAGTNPTGTGDCDGINGVKIPCSCPPSRDSFIAVSILLLLLSLLSNSAFYQSLSANVAAGHDIHNPGVSVAKGRMAKVVELRLGACSFPYGRLRRIADYTNANLDFVSAEPVWTWNGLSCCIDDVQCSASVPDK